MRETLWHTKTEEGVLQEVATTIEGLTSNASDERRKKFGRNVLPGKKPATLLRIILHQFLSPLIYVLLGAAVVSIFLNEMSDALFIFIILFINAIIGASQEWKAEAKASALQELIRIQVRTLRDGKISIIDSEDLVPGDIVMLESGNKVPADIRILKENNLTVDEALLTGESMAIRKKTGTLEEDQVQVAERTNMLFGGSTVFTGRVTGVVVATGSETEIGKIAVSLKTLDMGKAPLVERMEVFAGKISLYVLVSCVVLGGIGYFNGISLKEIFFFVVAVAVSAIPEGLPIAMTVALSIGASRMAKRNVIIRKLTAVEGLGSCTFIGTDKTGTLTVDQQTVRAIILPGETLTVSGEGYNGEGVITDRDGNQTDVSRNPELAGLIKTITICNEGSLAKNNSAWKHSGDPVDVAMLALAFKSGYPPETAMSAIEKLKEVPFESERRYAVVYYRDNGEVNVAVKGAVERILPHLRGGVDTSMVEESDRLAAEGFRIIAVAGGTVADVESSNDLPEVQLTGFVALKDPLRPEAKPAIAACRKAGVDVAMITGDHPSTALAIAKEVGIAGGESDLIHGTELDRIRQEGELAFREMVCEKKVFSRVSPQQKQQIVEALRNSGHYIAVTGDGVNDAPALKTANIGVAMGYGTDIAKETSSIIITDNNFASIVSGIEEGRFTYSNLRKIIYLLISTGAAELLMIAMSLIFQLPLPFLPLQLLWLNLVTNGIQDVSLAFEAGEKRVMLQPPRKPDERVFDPLMIRQTLFSAAVICLITFGLWYHLLNHLHWDEFSARNTILLLMVLLQNFHVFNCRSETESTFGIPLRNNIVLVLGTLAAQGIHVLAMHIPVTQKLLSLSPVSLIDWTKLFVTAALIVISMEAFKFYHRRRRALRP